MKVTIQRIDEESEKRSKGYHEDFTVFINEKRILSVYSPGYYSNPVADKWISEVRKANRKKKGPVVAGVSVDNKFRFRGGTISDDPSDMMTICIGSHCLVFTLPECFWKDGDYVRSVEGSKVLKDFLADPKMIFVGMDMGEVSNAMEKFQALKIARSGDVRALAVKLLTEERGYVSQKLAKSLTLEDAAKQLLDKRIEVDRPRKIDRLNDWGCRTYETHKEYLRFEINKEYVQFETLNAFLCHEIGMKYLEEFKKMTSN